MKTMQAATFSPGVLRAPNGQAVRLRPGEEDDGPRVVAYLNRIGGESPFLTFGLEGPGVTEDDVRRQAARARVSDHVLSSQDRHQGACTKPAPMSVAG